MKTIRQIIDQRDAAREQAAAPLAIEAQRALHEAGFGAWLIGSLARGEFRAHSDIDSLIEAEGVSRDEALKICLRALRDLPPQALAHFDREAADAARLRSH